MKIKHSVSSPPAKYGECFRKKALLGRIHFLGQIYGRMFYMGTNDQIMQGGKLMVKRFQRLSQVSFPLIDPDLGYWYIIWKVNTTNRGLNLKKQLLLTLPLGLGISCKVCLFKNKLQWCSILWCLHYRALLDVHIYGSDSWRSELRRYI